MTYANVVLTYKYLFFHSVGRRIKKITTPRSFMKARRVVRNYNRVLRMRLPSGGIDIFVVSQMVYRVNI